MTPKPEGPEANGALANAKQADMYVDKAGAEPVRCCGEIKLLTQLKVTSSFAILVNTAVAVLLCLELANVISFVERMEGVKKHYEYVEGAVSEAGNFSNTNGSMYQVEPTVDKRCMLIGGLVFTVAWVLAEVGVFCASSRRISPGFIVARLVISILLTILNIGGIIVAAAKLAAGLPILIPTVTIVGLTLFQLLETFAFFDHYAALKYLQRRRQITEIIKKTQPSFIVVKS